jgi:hypothetical protein
MPDDFAEQSAGILFGGRVQERYLDPEVQGGKIALIATDNNKVQKPPNSLDRMHASLPKQVAYNQRVLSAENEIAGINCGVGEFLSQMRADPDEPVGVCVNAGGSFKRHEQHLGGQLWPRGDRHLMATNIQLDGMSNDAVSVTLAAVGEALEWTHTLEEGLAKRPTQRVVFYPPSLPDLAAVLESGNPELDTENDHNLAYWKILNACSKFELPPQFYRSDQVDCLESEIAAKVPGWMHSAEQVLEDGNDVCNSESDSDNEDHGSEIKDAYQAFLLILMETH